MTNAYESENMRTAQPDKRTRLIETATKLAYGRGFRETSLADIAEAARVPVGNVYYYFKTKEELAEAVVERRLEEFRAARMGEEAVKGMVARTPLGRLGTTSNVADVVAFLASPDARWVTGQVLDSTAGLAPPNLK